MGEHPILKNDRVVHNTVRRPRINDLLLYGVSDLSYYTSRGNRFQYNTCYLGADPNPFFWMHEHIGRRRWVSFEQDTRGTFIKA